MTVSQTFHQPPQYWVTDFFGREQTEAYSYYYDSNTIKVGYQSGYSFYVDYSYSYGSYYLTEFRLYNIFGTKVYTLGGVSLDLYSLAAGIPIGFTNQNVKFSNQNDVWANYEILAGGSELNQSGYTVVDGMGGTDTWDLSSYSLTFMEFYEKYYFQMVGDIIYFYDYSDGDQFYVSNFEIFKFKDLSLTYDEFKDLALALTDDSISGTNGKDLLSGLGGADTLSGGAGDDVLFGNKGADRLVGGSGGDNLFGGQQNDTLFGLLGPDAIYGNKQNDTLYGGAGSDFLYGGQDDDLVFGNEGNDRVDGNKGNDTLHGGNGSDNFIFSKGVDRIKDFSKTEDKIVSGYSYSELSQRVSGNSLIISDGVGNSLIIENMSTPLGSEYFL